MRIKNVKKNNEAKSYETSCTWIKIYKHICLSNVFLVVSKYRGQKQSLYLANFSGIV